MQGSTTNTADNDRINMVPAKSGNRVAGAMLVNLVAVAD
jgi:hypothetical protein